MLSHRACRRRHLLDGGRTLLVRAISDIPKGGEVSVSYLAEEQLYAPWAERKALPATGTILRRRSRRAPPRARRRARRWPPSGGARRPARRRRRRRWRRSSGSSGCGGSGASRRRRRRRPVQSARRSRRCARCSTTRSSARCTRRTGLRRRRARRSSRSGAARRPRPLALLAATAHGARGDLALGTPHLASLYATHASASFRLLGEKRCRTRSASCTVRPPPPWTPRRRIRTICFGDAPAHRGDGPRRREGERGSEVARAVQ